MIEASFLCFGLYAMDRGGVVSNKSKSMKSVWLYIPFIGRFLEVHNVFLLSVACWQWYATGVVVLCA